MFKHYIFTRWNKMDDHMDIYNNPSVPDPEAWMEHRAKLFNEITIPSVMSQTSMNFTWLLSFSDKTPRKITDYYSTWPNVKVIFEYPKTWLNRVAIDGEWIITTRMDNDDYLGREYIQRVQEQFDNKFLLVDTDGRQWDMNTGRLYTVERKTCNSPFISLIEQVGTDWMSISSDPQERKLITDRVKTVFYCSHSKMEWHFPAVKINEVLYRMVIHDRNISNKIVGHEIQD